MTYFIFRRVGLAFVTLAIVSVIVFVGAQLLPGDVGRLVLGQFATQQAVDVYNHQLGLDRPIFIRYWDWISHFVRGDLGISYQYKIPVSTLLGPSLVNSAKLATFAVVLIVPISILGGVIAALRRDRLTDRVISIAGLSMTAIPEFVTAVVLITIFGIWVHAVPVSAAAPPGAGFFTTVDHLILPAASLALVYFGYLSRMARAGIIETLDADYTRTAYLKGLSQITVIHRHVIRNALLPTIAVLATQIGFIFGGLVVVESIFNYNGLGQRLYTAAKYKDFAVMQSGAMLTGIILVTSTLIGDILIASLGPENSRRASDVRSTPLPTSPTPPVTTQSAADLPAMRGTDELRIARREQLRLLIHSRIFMVGLTIVVFWSLCAVLGSHITPYDPLAQSSNILKPPSSAHWFGTDRFGRDVFSRVLAGARSIMVIAPIATALAVIVGTGAALVVGFYGGLVDEVAGRFIEANLAIPGIIITVIIIAALGTTPLTIICVVALGFSLLIARTIRVAVLAERNLDYVKGAQLRGARSPYIMFIEILPNITGPVVVEATVRLGYAIFAIASLTFLGFGVQPPSPDWALQISENYSLVLSGTDWWTVLFPAFAISTLVVAINLMADALAQIVSR